MSELREVQGYPNYKISSEGIIYNKRNRVLKPHKSNNGYLQIGLYKDKKFSKRATIHRLVACAFVVNSDPSKFDQVNHKNGIKTDNRAINLEWTNQKGNNKHKFEVLKYHGVGRKLTDEQAKQIRESNLSSRKAAKFWNVDQLTIIRIRLNRIYKSAL